MLKRVTSGAHTALSAAIVAVAAFQCLSALMPQARLWGGDACRHLPPALSILLTAALLALAVPAVQRWLSSRADALSDRSWRWLFIGLAAAVVLAAIMSPMETWYYGDGGPLVTEVFKIGHTPSYSSDIMRNVKSSPVAGLLLDALTRGIPPLLSVLGFSQPATNLFPFLALGLLSFLALTTGVALLADVRDRTMLLMLLLGSAGTLLFFSYVEFYVPVYVALAVFVLTGMRTVEGEGPLWRPALAWLVAAGMHVYSVALLPALLYVWMRRNARIRAWLSVRMVLLLPAAGLAAAAVLYVAAGFARGDSRIVMPYHPVATPAGVQAYTLLSSAHLADLVNLLLLLAPIPLLFLLFSVRTCRSAWSQPSVQFAWLAAAFFLVFLFFANTSLGLARDWDLTAPLGILIALLAYAVIRAAGGAVSAVRPAFAAAAVMSVLPWMLMQLDTARATQRYESIIDQDAPLVFTDYALSGYEALRKHYMHTGDAANEMRVIRRMIGLPGYAEQYRMYLDASVTQALTDPSSFRAQQQWMLGALQRSALSLRERHLDHDYHISLRQIDSIAMASACNAFGNATHEELAPDLRAFSAATGLPGAANVLDGIGAFITNRYADAIAPLTAVMDAGFAAPRLCGMLGSSLVATGRMQDADRVFAKGEQLFPQDAEQLFLRAAAYLRIGVRRDESVALLRRAHHMTLEGPARAQVDEVLKDLGVTP